MRLRDAIRWRYRRWVCLQWKNVENDICEEFNRLKAPEDRTALQVVDISPHDPVVLIEKHGGEHVYMYWDGRIRKWE